MKKIEFMSFKAFVSFVDERGYKFNMVKGDEGDLEIAAWFKNAEDALNVAAAIYEQNGIDCRIHIDGEDPVVIIACCEKMGAAFVEFSYQIEEE